jgi:LPS export ABC transporter protein LptC
MDGRWPLTHFINGGRIGSMTRKQKNGSRRNRMILMAFLTAALGLSAIMYFGGWQSRSAPAAPGQPLPAGVGLSLGEIHQTAIREGRKEWHLDAATANYLTAQNQIELKRLSVTFYLDERQELLLTADSGTLNNDTRDFSIYGNVTLTSGTSRLLTDEAHYVDAQRRFLTDKPVEIVSPTYHLNAEGMTLDLDTQRTVFKGQVKGVLRENFSL